VGRLPVLDHVVLDNTAYTQQDDCDTQQLLSENQTKISSEYSFINDSSRVENASLEEVHSDDGFWISQRLQQQTKYLGKHANSLENKRSSTMQTLTRFVKGLATQFTEDLYSTAAPASFCPWPPKHYRVSNKKKNIYYKGEQFASLTEAALAGVLEYYVPGFNIEYGKTYEVPLLGKSRVDFSINGILLEFHSPRLGHDENNIGDFLTKEDYRNFKAQITKVGRNKHQRKKLLKETRAKVFQIYAERRQTLLALSKRSGQELVIVRSREEFYSQVLCRFAQPNVPLFPEFVAMFWWLIDVVLRENNMTGLRGNVIGVE